MSDGVVGVAALVSGCCVGGSAPGCITTSAAASCEEADSVTAGCIGVGSIYVEISTGGLLPIKLP